MKLINIVLLIIIVFLILYLFKQNLSNEFFSPKPRPPRRPIKPVAPVFPIKPTRPRFPRPFSWPKFQKFMKDSQSYNSRMRQYNRDKWRWGLKYKEYQNKYKKYQRKLISYTFKNIAYKAKLKKWEEAQENKRRKLTGVLGEAARPFSFEFFFPGKATVSELSKGVNVRNETKLIEAFTDDFKYTDESIFKALTDINKPYSLWKTNPNATQAVRATERQINRNRFSKLIEILKDNTKANSRLFGILKNNTQRYIFNSTNPLIKYEYLGNFMEYMPNYYLTQVLESFESIKLKNILNSLTEIYRTSTSPDILKVDITEVEEIFNSSIQSVEIAEAAAAAEGVSTGTTTVNELFVQDATYVGAGGDTVAEGAALRELKELRTIENGKNVRFMSSELVNLIDKSAEELPAKKTIDIIKKARQTMNPMFRAMSFSGGAAGEAAAGEATGAAGFTVAEAAEVVMMPFFL